MGNRKRRGKKMEQHMEQTITEIDRRIPDGLRAAFSIYRASWTGDEEDEFEDEDEAANFAAVLLAPRGDDACCSYDPADSDGGEEPETEGGLGMVFASSYIKDHDEDAHFGHAEAGVIGVADGVGAYRDQGVDASAFSRALMHNAFAEVAMSAVPGTRFCPLVLLEQAYEMTTAARTPGASTAAIVSLAGRTLKWAYVGDSGIVVLRDGRILRRSRPQQHYFNCPYQLNSKQDPTTTPDDADVGEVAAKEGDIVILGTDGLFDNVSDDEIERMVRMGTALEFAPENMAEVIAAFAYEASSCDDRHTPFSLSVKDFMGGKPDDITVVVAYIVRSQI